MSDFISPIRHNFTRIRQTEAIDNDSPNVEWKRLARTPENGSSISNKIAAIKSLRARHGFGLKEAKDVVEAYAEEVMFRNDSPRVTRVTLSPTTFAEVTRDAKGLNKVNVFTTIGTTFSDSEVLQVIANLAIEHGNN